MPEAEAVIEVLPPSKVKPVVVSISQAVLVPARVIELRPPNVNDLVFELSELNLPIVNNCPLVSSDPLVSVTVAALPVAMAPVNFHEPPTPLKLTLPALLPPKFTFCWVVEVETKSIAAVVVLPKVYVHPEVGKIKALLLAPAVPSPIKRVVAKLWLSVPVYPVRTIDLTKASSPATMVTLPEVAVATTSSAAVGTAPSTHVPVSSQFPPASDMVLVAAWLKFG